MKENKMMMIVACVCAPVMIASTDVSAQQIGFTDQSMNSTETPNTVKAEGILHSGFDFSMPVDTGMAKLADLDISNEGMLNHNTQVQLSNYSPREKTEQSYSFQFTGIGAAVPDRSVMTSVLPAIGGLMILGFAGLLALRWPSGASL